MISSEFYFDKNPARYAKFLWDRCTEWWRSIEGQVQEEYDMAMGRDAWMMKKGAMGFSDLTIPLIYVISEARKATMLEMLLRKEPFFRFEPIDENSVMARVSAERKEDAMQNMRQDLEWDQVILDLFDSCEFSSHSWVSIEQRELRIGPQHGLLATSDLYGTNKLFNTFGVLSPGQVIIDGFRPNDHQVPSRFKLAFMPYHELVRRYPERTGDWIRKYAKKKEDSAYYNPNESKKGRSTDVQGMFDQQGSDDWNSGDGFLVAEGHLWVPFSDDPENPRHIIYTFLPEVTQGATETDNSQWGHRLSVEETGVPFPFEGISGLVQMARGRTLPYTMEGVGTAKLLLPLQREFSDELATERDLDRQYLEPQMAFRKDHLVGKETPPGPGEHWQFSAKDDGFNKISIRDLITPIHTTTPNRGYLTNTRQEVRALAELIGAAMEATTGGATDPNEKVGIFKERSAGSASRINLVFFQHAMTLRRAGGTILSIMAEVSEEYLNPGIRANSATWGGASSLERDDILSPSRMGIPSLEEYAKREMERVMWMTTGEVINNIMGPEAFETKVLLVEDILRAQTRNEMRTQQYVQAAGQGIQRAQMMQAMAAIPPEVGGGGQGSSPLLARTQSQEIGV